MNNPDLTAWFQQEGLNQHGAVANNVAMFQLGLGYDFSTPDFGSTLHFTTPGAQLPSTYMPPSSATTTRPHAKTRVSLACIPCRSRHTKCDAITPVCSQCRASDRSCSYAESRRGRGKQAVEEQRQLSSNDEVQSELGKENQRSGSVSNATSATHSVQSISSSWDLRLSPIDLSPVGTSNGTTVGLISEPECSSKLLDLYYAFFHDAHPYVLPRQYLDQRLQIDGASLHHVLPVLEFVGSLFAQSPAKKVMQERAESILLTDTLPANGFTVQALLTFAIAVHSCDEFTHARVILDRAICIALHINMCLESFATSNGEGSAVLAESWRRTWWYLYLTDGIFSGIRHRISFALRDIQSDVNLPCEDSDYNYGVSIIFTKSLYVC
jgi:hypothetical protein